MQLADAISSYSQIITLGGSLILVFLVFLSLAVKHLTPLVKKILFISIASTVISVTAFLAGSTIYLNMVSISKGPVHYHADIEIWNCGEEVDLMDPEEFSNKVGTSILHEHNDKRIHLEGVVVEEKDASLGRYFEAIGGNLTSDSLSISEHEGQLNLISGQTCPDGQVGILQVFVYKTVRDNFYQQKIGNPQNYIYSPQANVPPGDCIIIEFGEPKERTDKICQSYKVSQTTGKLKGEIIYGN